MNSFATLTLIYALFTLISSGILYSSFRKKMDDSAVYFLISELCMGATCAVIFLINMKVIYVHAIWTAIPNFAALAAEISVLFSVLSLTKKVKKKWFGFALLISALLAIFLELIRPQVTIQTIVWIFSVALMSLFVVNYLVCKFKFVTTLSNNEFMRFFTWFELGMVFYGLIRLIVNFFPTPIIPRDTPSNLAVLIYSFYIVLGAFRYISYIGLRITWVNPSNPSQNRLNKPLAQALEEKDQLLKGLISSNRVLGISALASSLAHQLCQPLTTIALRADTIRRELTQHDHNLRLIGSLDEISGQSTKLAELVKNLRGLFSARSNTFASVSLQNITDEIIEIVEPSLKAKKIALIKNYQSNPIVYGDSIQIQQVLINIFNNAIDALTQSPIGDKKIIVGISHNQKCATLEITDNGLGIQPEILAKIFELYQTTKPDGLGVGLWLSKAIMDRHHGSIAAFNGTNNGAIFKIEIPLHHTLSE